MTLEAARRRASREREDGVTSVIMKAPTPFSDGSFYAVFREGDPRAVDCRGGLRVVETYRAALNRMIPAAATGE